MRLFTLIAALGSLGLCGQSYPPGLNVYLYPTTFLRGDLSVGIEHRVWRQVSSELSIKTMVFIPELCEYDKGSGVCWTPKITYWKYKKLSLKAGLALALGRLSSSSRLTNYYYIQIFHDQANVSTASPFLLRRESRLREELLYGPYLGITIEGKRLSAGLDFMVTYASTKENIEVEKVLYTEPQFRDPLPAEGDISSTQFQPSVRAKVGWIIFR